MLAHAGLLAVSDLVSNAGTLVALGADNLHLAGIQSSLTLHDAALFTLAAGLGVLGLCMSLMLSYLEPLVCDYRVTVLDVGQGQCILRQSEGRTFLVDCGGSYDDDAADAVAEELHKQGIARLDGIVITHYDADHAGWYVADQISTAIGQSDNLFTPMQLCSYVNTLANAGTRYRATFLNRVVSSDYRTLVFQNEPEIAYSMNLNYQTVEMYMDGMRKVVYAYGGTADHCFGGADDKYGVGDGIWPMKNKVDVWAKTGTAQHSSGGSDHGSFICFAAKKGGEPEVAIALYGEKIAHGSSLAPVAEDILEVYFEKVAASDVFTYENKVG